MKSNIGKRLTDELDRRYDTDFLTLQKLIATNSLGRIAEFESHFDRHVPTAPSTWKGKNIAGGGAIYDLGSHLLDQIVYLFGLPTAVTAFIGTQRTKENNPTDYPEYFTVICHYSNGMSATAKGTCISPETAQLRYWVRGEKGSFKKYHLDVQEHQLRFEGMKPTDANYAQEPKEYHGILTTAQVDGSFCAEVVPTAYDENYRTFYASFVKALASEGAVPVPPEEVVKVIRLIEMCKESARLRKTVEL